jgi:hypothetical protein
VILSEPSDLAPARAPTAARPRARESERERERERERASASTTMAAPRGTTELTIYVQPFGEVWIDGKRAGQSPVTVKLAPGDHEIGVGDARIEQRRGVTLKPGESQSVEIRRKDFGE